MRPVSLIGMTSTVRKRRKPLVVAATCLAVTLPVTLGLASGTALAATPDTPPAGGTLTVHAASGGPGAPGGPVALISSDGSLPGKPGSGSGASAGPGTARLIRAFGLGLETSTPAAGHPALAITAVQGGPAAAAGLKSGDVIERINGSAPFAHGSVCQEAMKQLRRPPSDRTPVHLQVRRPATGRTWTVDLAPAAFTPVGAPAGLTAGLPAEPPKGAPTDVPGGERRLYILGDDGQPHLVQGGEVPGGAQAPEGLPPLPAGAA